MPDREEFSTKPRSGASARARPTRVIPTDRINFAKQMELLRAYAAASTPDHRPVGLKDAAEVAGIHASNVSAANSFFLDCGLMTRPEGGGGLVPSEEVFAYAHANEWDPATAAQKLRPIVERTWFATALMPKLAFKAMEATAVVTVLGEAAAAGPDVKKQLGMLVDYLAAAGLVSVDGGVVKAIREREDAEAGRRLGKHEDAQRPAPKKDEEPPRRREAPVAPAPMHGSGIHLNIEIAIEARDLATWTPERVSAFFKGLADVMAAKSRMEGGAP